MRTKPTKRASDKKYIGQGASAEPKQQVQSIPRFSCDANGRIVDICTKTCGWQPIRTVNAYHLQKVLEIIEQEGKKFNKCWYAIDQELKRRQSSGEIKPKCHEVFVD